VSRPSVERVAAMFAQPEYVRERLCPKPGDRFYLVLSDLLLALRELDTTRQATVLDYGCGASPYRSLFQACEYRRADILPSLECEYLISPDGTVPESSSMFDVILSTQVLEHVRDPRLYLAECFRLLKPGGILALSTHGLYEEHGCPDDFQRWTAEGLTRDVQLAGFEIVSLKKLTTGPRAVVFFVDRFADMASPSRRSLPGLLHWLGRSVWRRSRSWIHACLDRYYSEYRVVASGRPNHEIYVCLFCCARRPC
jgi:SAM-dependent methyltransferase